MLTCQVEGIKFQTLKYRICATATTRDDHITQYQGDHTIDWSGYADDLLLVFENAEELQKAFILLNDTFKRLHPQMNIGKKKFITVNSHQHLMHRTPIQFAAFRENSMVSGRFPDGLFPGPVRSGKHPSGKCVSGKRPFGEMSGHSRGNIRSGKSPVGKTSDGEMSVGEMSVGGNVR